jgi:hypothetical protein
VQNHAEQNAKQRAETHQIRTKRSCCVPNFVMRRWKSSGHHRTSLRYSQPPAQIRLRHAGHATAAVADVDAIYARLSNAGVKFDGHHALLSGVAGRRIWHADKFSGGYW